TDPWVEPSGWSKFYSEAQFAPVQTQLQTAATAYVNGDGFNFSRAANQLRDNLRDLSPAIYPQERQLQLESFYNHFEAFYRAIWCYGIALVILIAAHLRKRGRALQNIGVAVALLALAFHASGIVMRCMIAGRPPVTNMYESIIWVSFAVSFFGMIFFARYQAPVYVLAALPVTLIALLLVHQMPIAMPSSIDPLVPVLRDNFWLTVHVLTITLSYAVWLGSCGRGLVSRRANGVVRRELCFGQRSPQLRIRYRRRDVCRDVPCARSFIRCVCDLAILHQQIGCCSSK